MSVAKESEILFGKLVEALARERIGEDESAIDSMKYSEMELLGHGLGKELSVRVQRELVARQAQRIPSVFHCPTCQEECPTDTKPKRIQSLDGEVELSEVRCYCRKCRRSFFPSA